MEKSANKSMDKARILTAAVLLPLLILAILKGPPFLLLALALLAALIAWHEYAGMAALPSQLLWPGCLGLIISFLIIWQKGPVLAPGIWLGFFLFMLLFLRRYQAPQHQQELIKALFGYIYVLLGFSHLFLVLTLPAGRSWFLCLIAVIFGTDTGAYYAGRILGKHKLSPFISPKKTWEGAFGGTFLGILLGLSLGLYFKLASVYFLIPIFLLVSVVGQIGDLFESIIKRGFGVKDSGRLLPGHGGILDRTDALIFAAPLFYWLMVWTHG
ncbi:phosphatidate cytidylyltransferase [Thermodesulfatator atlanticus]